MVRLRLCFGQVPPHGVSFFPALVRHFRGPGIVVLVPARYRGCGFIESTEREGRCEGGYLGESLVCRFHAYLMRALTIGKWAFSGMFIMFLLIGSLCSALLSKCQSPTRLYSTSPEFTGM